MEPLASFGNSKSSSNTNVSTSVSLSILDQDGNEIPLRTNNSQPIEIIIPRDPNVIIPSMILQNVTSINSTPHNQLFQLHYANITNSLPVSVHLELHPLNSSLAYLLIYKLDQIPQLNSSINQVDGWSIFCPGNLSNESIYTYFIDNQRTQGHQSLSFGLRELNSIETIDYCFNTSLAIPPITNQRFNFKSNYEVRIYTSGCYYLDQNNQWKSDGLVVGPLTNHYQTQCFSTHLTTFDGGFIVLPEPVNWQYVFANADFMRNKTIYLTIISVMLIYLILIIYTRYKDFFGTVKMIRLSYFNSRICLLIQTLKNACKELLSFSLMFSIVSIAFICLFYLLFQSKLWSAASFFQTAEMLFEMTLMKFDAHELTDAAAFLGPFCFSLFILLVVFVCLSMFITIINESFRQARETIMNNDQEIYSYMLDRFLRWTGKKKSIE